VITSDYYESHAQITGSQTQVINWMVKQMSINNWKWILNRKLKKVLIDYQVNSKAFFLLILSFDSSYQITNIFVLNLAWCLHLMLNLSSKGERLYNHINK